MADEIGTGDPRYGVMRPAQESDVEAYRRQQQIKSSAFELAGMFGPGVKAVSGAAPKGASVLGYVVKHPDTGEIKQFGLEHGWEALNWAERVGTKVMTLIKGAK